MRLQDLVDKLQLKVKAYKRAAEEAVSVEWKVVSCVDCVLKTYLNVSVYNKVSDILQMHE